MPSSEEGTNLKAHISMPVLYSLFFFSGASSLIIETVFSRLLTYTFGNTAQAVSTVLAAFLGGLAVGAFCFGMWIDHRQPSPPVYGLMEASVALCVLFIPNLFGLLTLTYVYLYPHFSFAPSANTALRFGLASAVILPVSFLMGGTLPVLSCYVASCDAEFRSKVDRLYGWNTLGAATGALISTYLLIPSLGIPGTIYVACATNVLICICTAALPKAPGRTVQTHIVDHGRSIPSSTNAAVLLKSPYLLLVGAFLAGATALGYEVIWTHVQAFTIGNTVYAFGVTLFVMLCGLGLGAHLVAKKLREPQTWGVGLVGSQVLLGTAVFFTLPWWGRLPDLFGRGYVGILQFDAFALAFFAYLGIIYGWRRTGRHSRRQTSPARDVWQRVLLVAGGLLAVGLTLCVKYEDQIILNTVLGSHTTLLFVGGELMRFLVAFFLLIIPSILLGAAFPLFMNLFSRSVDDAGSHIGTVYAVNTFGAIAGCLLTGFVLIPLLGSQATLRSLATCNVALGLLFALLLISASTWRKLVWAPTALALVLLGWFSPKNWNPRTLCNGAYVYFAPIRADRVLYQREDVAGGMTSVVENRGFRTMLSNGKFQGNNSAEAAAQIRFSLIPILFTHARNSSLVIGLGTGQTLHTLSLFPFQRIDVAELAPQIVEAAKSWFTDVNGGVLDKDARVHLSIADGRNFLLVSRHQYDLITIEVSSIWIDGEADLYNKEFYELCRQHLADGGVLQQWVQLHHMRRANLLVVLNTVVRTFPHVALFVGGGQGLIIASQQPLESDYQQLRRWDSNPEILASLRDIHAPAMEALLGDLMLYGDSLNRALAILPKVASLAPDFVSSDFHPYLEYETPKGNMSPPGMLTKNLEFLEALRPDPLPTDLLIRNVPSEDERNLLRGYVLAEERETQSAIQYFDRVHGSFEPLAREEIARLQSNETAPLPVPGDQGANPLRGGSSFKVPAARPPNIPPDRSGSR